MSSIIDYFADKVLWLFSSFLESIVDLIGSIDVPDFISNGLSGLVNAIPSDMQYFLFMSGLNDAFLIISSAVMFRLTRKALTLGRW